MRAYETRAVMRPGRLRGRRGVVPIGRTGGLTVGSQSPLLIGTREVLAFEAVDDARGLRLNGMRSEVPLLRGARHPSSCFVHMRPDGLPEFPRGDAARSPIGWPPERRSGRTAQLGLTLRPNRRRLTMPATACCGSVRPTARRSPRQRTETPRTDGTGRSGPRQMRLMSSNQRIAASGWPLREQRSREDAEATDDLDD